MSNWEDAPSEWEDAEENYSSPSGPGALSARRNLGKKDKSTQTDFWKGLGETALNVGTGLGAQVMAVPSMINDLRSGRASGFDDAFGKAMEEYTYQPRTEKGQEYSETVGNVINNIGLPLAGVLHAPVQGSSKLGRGGAALPREAAVEAVRPLPEGSSKLDKLKARTEAKWEDGSVPEDFWKQRAEQMTADARAAEAAKGQEPLYVNRHGQALDADALAQQDLAVAGRNVDLEQVKSDRLNEQMQNASEGELPFSTSVEDIAAKQNEGTKQADMFLDNTAHEADVQNGMQAAKNADIEKAYAQRAQEVQRETENQSKRDGLNDYLTEVEDNLRANGYTPKGGGQGPKTRAFNKQRGVIDVQGITDGLRQYKEGALDDAGYLARWRGTFSDKELNHAMNVLRDPTHSEKIVFMSPEEFHNIAEKRSEDFKSSTARRESVREALKSENGLDDIPYLKGVVKDGEFKVTSHNGRHRMDVFQEQGVEAVPVRVSGVDIKALMEGRDAKAVLPDSIKTQNNTSTSFSGMSKRQRGAVDFSFGDKRTRELIAEENRDAKKMMEMANSARQYADYKYLSEDAGKFFNDNKFLFEKLAKLREFSPWIPDQQLSHDASLSFSRLESAFDHFKKALDNPEEVGREVQNVRFLLNEMDHLDIQQKYLEAVSEYRSGLNMRSKHERATAKQIDEAIGNVSNIRNSPGNGQRGAIDLGVPNKTPGSKIAELTPDSPEVVAAKNVLTADRKREVMSKTSGLEGYRTNVDTPEKVLALAPEAKDLGPTQTFKAKTISPGMNAVAISSNNPLLKFTRDSVGKTIRETEALTRQYVTGPEGFGAKMKKLSMEEKNEVVAALQHADRKQMELSPESLKESGYSDAQISFIQHIQKMDAAKLEIWNKVRSDLGLPLVKDRMGHFAGNFDGDYKTVVLDKDKNAVGVIGTNTLWSNKMIQKKVLAKNPDVSFADTKRKPLGGSGARANMFAGFQDMIGVLAKDDPRFAHIQEIVDAAIKERGDSLYGASLHDKQKKGVWGNEGNKFWEDRDTNTKQSLKAFVDYWESGIASHLNLPTEVRLKELMDNPALDHMPRAKEYVNDYINNFTGRNLGTFGDALNKIIDTPGRLLGVGPSAPRFAITQFNKRASQMTMGFINLPFMLTQYLQVLQMGVPELMKIKDNLGMSAMEYTAATSKAMSDGLKIANEKLTGKPANLDAFTKESYDFARNNGLLEFSEFANSRNIFQNKASKIVDKVMDDIPVIGRTDVEATTRPYVFFAAANMLKDSGMSKAEVFDTALNLTNHAMVNYHSSEKPLMYSRLGVVGQAAGALQTFKHAFLGQLGTLMKDAAKGHPGPLAAALVSMGVLAGVKGVPFYQELDELVKSLTDSFFHKRMSIADIAMKNSPEVLKANPWTQDVIGSGALSTATGVNMQSRLSAADVLPSFEKGPVQALGEAISPFGSYGVKVGKDVWDLASNRDMLAAKNLAVTLAPSGTAKGLTERALKVNDKNQSINKKGQVDYQRSPFDSNLRTLTGATSLKESLDKEHIYNQQLNLKSRQEKQKSITQDAERLVAQNILSKETLKPLLEKYKAEGGDPQILVSSLIDFKKSMGQTSKQRLQGVPSNNVGSVTKYRNFND